MVKKTWEDLSEDEQILYQIEVHRLNNHILCKLDYSYSTKL